MFKRFKLKDYVPIKDKMYADRMWVRVYKEPSFKLCFKRNISDNFFTDLESLYSEDRLFTTNTIIQVSGMTGAGKSVCVISLAKGMDKNFNQLKNVKFYDQELLDEFKNNPKDSVIIRDENPAKGVFGMGSTRIENQLEVVGDTARKNGLSLIFVEPEWKKNDIAKWYLETIDMGSVTIKGKVHRVNRIGVKEPHTELFVGCILLGIIDEDDEDWVAYNLRKDKFIKEVLDADFSGAKMDFEDIATNILEEMDLSIYKTMKEKKLFILKKYPSYTNQEIDMILTAVKLLEKKGVV